jgi:hypothetical protein
MYVQFGSLSKVLCFGVRKAAKLEEMLNIVKSYIVKNFNKKSSD